MAVFPKPLFGPDYVMSLKKPVVSLNKIVPAQQPPHPEEEHKARDAPQCGRKIHPPKMEPLGAHEEGPKGSNGVPRDRRKYILYKSTQTQQQIDEYIGKPFKKLQEAIQIGHLLRLLLGD